VFGLNDCNTTFWIIAKWVQFPRAHHIFESLSSRFSTGLIFRCHFHACLTTWEDLNGRTLTVVDQWKMGQTVQLQFSFSYVWISSFFIAFSRLSIPAHCFEIRVLLKTDIGYP